MTGLGLRAIVLAALKQAGLRGMTADELLSEAARQGLVPRTRNAVPKAISQLNIEGRATIVCEKVDLSRRYVLIKSLNERSIATDLAGLEAVENYQFAPDLPPHASLTAALCGDPVPGRSFWDRLTPQQREVRA